MRYVVVTLIALFSFIAVSHAKLSRTPMPVQPVPELNQGPSMKVWDDRTQTIRVIYLKG